MVLNQIAGEDLQKGLSGLGWLSPALLTLDDLCQLGAARPLNGRRGTTWIVKAQPIAFLQACCRMFSLSPTKPLTRVGVGELAWPGAQ